MADFQAGHILPEQVYDAFEEFLNRLSFSEAELNALSPFSSQNADAIARYNPASPGTFEAGNVLELPSNRNGARLAPQAAWHNGWRGTHATYNAAVAKVLSGLKAAVDSNAITKGEAAQQLAGFIEALQSEARSGTSLFYNTPTTSSANRLASAEAVFKAAKANGITPNLQFELPRISQATKTAIGKAAQRLGLAATILGGMATAASAAQKYSEGDTAGGTAELGGFAGSLAGGIAGAEFLGALGTFAGPWGTLAGGLIGGIGGGIIGGVWGESAGRSFFGSSSKDNPAAGPSVNYDTSFRGYAGPSQSGTSVGGGSFSFLGAWGDFGGYGGTGDFGGFGGFGDSGSGGWGSDYSGAGTSWGGSLDAFFGGGADYSGGLSFGDFSTSWGGSSTWGGISVGWTLPEVNGFPDGAVSPSGGDWGAPVILDLSGDGLNITPLDQSNIFFDLVGDGYQHRTAWAGAGDGVLVLDLVGNGQITERNQVVFTDWDPTASNDMEALAHVFDTNRNGKLDAGDQSFSAFKILVTNADGTTTLKTLAEAGVASIDLTPNAAVTVMSDGSTIDGETTFTRTDGTTGVVAAVTLSVDAAGYVVQQTVTHNSGGSTTIDNKALNADGSVAHETIGITSADGRTRTLSYDIDGDGVIDKVQTIATSVAGDGTKLETFTNATRAGVLIDRTVTTTSADGVSITIERDLDGDGLTDQREVRTKNTDDSSSTVVTDLNPDGSRLAQTTSLVGADGLTRIVSSDLDGNGTVDLTEIDATVIAADGSRTETISDTNGDGSPSGRTVIATSADGLTKTTSVDSDGDGLVDLVRTSGMTIDAGGSSTTTITQTNRDGSLREKKVTAISADGLSTTSQTDLNGDGVFNLTTTDTTVVGADGARTQTITNTNADGSLRDKTVSSRSADGRRRTTQIDDNGDGGFETVESVAPNASGATVDTLSAFNDDGSLAGRTITTTSADGLAVTTEADIDGNGALDNKTTATTVNNADGSSTVTELVYSADGVLRGKSASTSSADGLSATVQSDTDGDGVFDQTTSDVIVINGDGSQSETVSVLATNGNLLNRTITTTSADRKTVAVVSDLNGDGPIDQATTTAVQPDGTVVETVSALNPNGSLRGKTVTTTSANGLSTTVQTDLDGDGNFDGTTTDVTVLNGDGSKTETALRLAGNGTLISRTVTTTSATGLSVTVNQDSNGDGAIDGQTTSITTLNANGSQTETVSRFSANHTLISKTITTTSADGLSTTAQHDLNGDGSVDLVAIDATVLNADGSEIETITDTRADGSLQDKSVTTTHADGRYHSLQVDSDGDGVFDQTEVIETLGTGNLVDTLAAWNPDGSLQSKVVTTTSASGLALSVETDLNGDGIVDQTVSDVVSLNADGSSTEVKTTYAGTTRINQETKTTGAEGRVTTVSSDRDGNGSSDLNTRSELVTGADGSTTETTAEDYGDGIPEWLRVVWNSADQMTRTDDTYLVNKSGNGNTYRYLAETSKIQADGSILLELATPVFALSSEVQEVSTTKLASLLVSSQSSQYSYADSWGNYLGDQASEIHFHDDGQITTTETNSEGYSISRSKSADGLSQQSVVVLSVDGAQPLVMSGSYTKTVNADGSTSELGISTVSQPGVIAGERTDRAVVTSSADGLTRIGQLDIDGDARFDVTSEIRTLLDGSSEQTITRLNVQTGSLLQKDVAAVSADGHHKSLEVDSDGDGISDHFMTSVVNANGSTTVTEWDQDVAGAVLYKTVTTTSADARSTLLETDTNGDGVIDATKSTVISLERDGRRIETATTKNDALGIQATARTVTSANGLSATTEFDFDSDGAIDRTSAYRKEYHPDGSSSEIIEIGGLLSSREEVNVSDDGRTTSSHFWSEKYEQHGSVTRNSNGSFETDTWFGVNWFSAGGYVIPPSGPSPGIAGPAAWGESASYAESTYTSADGLMSSIGVTEAPWYWASEYGDGGGGDNGGWAETTLRVPGANGSYTWSSSQGKTSTHTVDDNGIDTWVWSEGGTHTTVRLDLEAERAIFEKAQRIYDAGLDRAMLDMERENLAIYIKDGVLDVVALADSILSGALATVKTPSFGTKYAVLTDAQFVERIYMNALGQGPSKEDLKSYLDKLEAKSITRGGLLASISESPEHRAIGVVSGMDLAQAYGIVSRLFVTALSRSAAASELTTNVLSLTQDGKSIGQVAGTVVESSEFAAKYAGMSNAEIVRELLINSGDNAAQEGERQAWVAALDAGRVTLSDLVAAFAQRTGKVAAGDVPDTTPDKPDGSTGPIDGTVIAESKSNATINVGSGVTEYLTGDYNTVNANTGARVTVNGNANTINALGLGEFVDVLGGRVRDEVREEIVGWHYSTSGYDTILEPEYGYVTVTVEEYNTINASNDRIAVEAGSLAIVNGAENEITIMDSSTLRANGTGNSLDVAGTNVSAFVSSAQVILEAGASAIITGDNNAIMEKAGAAVAVNGAKASIFVEGTGATATVASGHVILETGASATVTGDGNTIALIGSDVLNATGTGLTVDINGRGNSVTTSRATIIVEDGAGTTVMGSSNTISVKSSAQVVVNGADNAVTIMGSGSLLSMDGGSITVVSGGAAEIRGKSISIVVASGATIVIDGASYTAAAGGITGTIDSTGRVTIIGSMTNHSPVAQVLAAQSSPEDTAVSFALPAGTFTDPDGDALTLSAAETDGTALPSWLAFNAATRTFTGTPPANWNGALDIRVTAADADGLSASSDFRLTVSPVNDAPVVAQALAAQSSSEDTPVSFTLPAGAFADLDGDALTLSASKTDGTALPSWLAFNAATRTFAGTPPANWNGALDIGVTAADADGLSASSDFRLTVSPVNDAPTLAPVNSSIALIVDDVASAASLLGAAADVDGDAIQSYYVSVSDASVGQWYLNNQPFSGVISPAQLANLSFHALSGGTETISIQASDGNTWSDVTRGAINVSIEDPSGGYSGYPVVLDLYGTGLDLIPLDESTAAFDYTGNGVRNHTAWVGPSNGLLVIDLPAADASAADGRIDQAPELSFKAWSSEATSDLDGLRRVFDTNHDEILDSSDARWNEFRIWQDLDQDGEADAGELSTLEQLKITSIGLATTGPRQVYSDGSVLVGTSTFTRSDGTTGLVGDYGFAYEAASAQQLIAAMSSFAPSPGAASTVDTQQPAYATLPLTTNPAHRSDRPPI